MPSELLLEMPTKATAAHQTFPFRDRIVVNDYSYVLFWCMPKCAGCVSSAKCVRSNNGAVNYVFCLYLLCVFSSANRNAYTIILGLRKLISNSNSNR